MFSTVHPPPLLGEKFVRTVERTVLNFSTVRSPVSHSVASRGRTVLNFSTVRSSVRDVSRSEERTVLKFSTVRSSVRTTSGRTSLNVSLRIP